jgi:hypothetical protein
MHRIPTLLAALAIPLIAAAAPPGREALLALASKTACEQPAPGHVVFAGDSAGLGACLGKVKGGEIAELRITSAGGDATETLALARYYRGHLDLLVVDGLCASSCANYLLPAAKRVRVMDHAYVLLHGALSLRDFDARKAEIAAAIRAETPTITDDELARTIASGRDGLIAALPAQQAFEHETLACADWLAPEKHVSGVPPDGSKFLVVTPEMAKRCLKTARVEAFWAPEPENQFAPGLGFTRARR